jgi:hypothetical protein
MNAYNIVNSHATGSVTGATNVGGLVGNNYWDMNPSGYYTNGTISNSYAATGTVTGGMNVGGLVGINQSTTSFAINTNYATGNVFGATNVGGLVGYLAASTVYNSYASGNVAGNGLSNTNLGGLVGVSNGTIDSSYASSTTVAGGANSSNVGGLVGFNGGIVSASHVSVGSISGVTDVGGLVGTNGGSGTISNSHYDINGVTINGANIVTIGGLYNDSTANFNNMGQYDDWLSHGNTLNIANYTISNGGSTFGVGGANIYTISNTQGLKDMLGFIDSAAYTFTLTSAIDMSTLPGFYVPIMAASFDGAGFAISNLTLNRSSTTYMGFFGTISFSSTVNNMQLVDASVNGRDNVGVLAGWNAGTISNSNVTTAGGNVSVTGLVNVGGLVGYNDGTINSSTFGTNSSGTASVTGTSIVGGLVGQHASGFIHDSGVIANSGGVVSVSGVDLVGGLVGNLAGGLDFSYVSSATITATNSSIGGLAGNITQAPIYSYFNVDAVTTNGGNNVTRGGLYSGQYSTWLSGGRHTQLAIGNYSTSLVLQGDGSYGISNQQGMKDMLAFSDSSLNNFSLTADIDLGTLPGFYVPILAGSFNGNNHTISNLNISLPNSDMGLFGNINFTSSVVSNLNLVNASVVGITNVGALAGINYGTIDNVSLSGTSSVSTVFAGMSVGGLVGHNDRGNISNSHVANAVVHGVGDVGGLVGSNSGSTSGGTPVSGIISNSYATNGSVTGSGYHIGGLVGNNWNGAIVDSHVINPTVNGGAASSVGGLAGYNYSVGTISNSYVSGGSVTSTGRDVGGLVGNNYAVVDRSWVDTVVVNGGLNVGGLVGIVDGGEGAGGIVSNSFALNTNVTGTTAVGGLVGAVSVTGGVNYNAVINSYVSGGIVSGSGDVGGLVGSNNTYITNSYADVASVTGGSTTTGALIGVNSGVINNSYWNSAIATGIGTNTGTASGSGLSALQMTSASNFVGWSIASTGGAGMVWRIYEGQTAPMLTSFLTPLTVTANDAVSTYSGNAFSGGNGVNYSVAGVGTSVLGTPVYGGTAQGATAVGTYAISVSGLYSNQLGYDISYADGTLTIAVPPPVIPPPKITTRQLAELVDTSRLDPNGRDKNRGAHGGNQYTIRDASTVEAPLLACRQ